MIHKKIDKWKRRKMKHCPVIYIVIWVRYLYFTWRYRCGRISPLQACALASCSAWMRMLGRSAVLGYAHDTYCRKVRTFREAMAPYCSRCVQYRHKRAPLYSTHILTVLSYYLPNSSIFRVVASQRVSLSKFSFRFLFPMSFYMHRTHSKTILEV